MFYVTFVFKFSLTGRDNGHINEIHKHILLFNVLGTDYHFDNNNFFKCKPSLWYNTSYGKNHCHKCI